MLVRNTHFMRLVPVFLLSMAFQFSSGQGSKFFGEKKVVPKIPPANERMRLLIVSDAKNEIDDVWAIALAILSPERFDLEGFVGSNFDHTHTGVGPKSIALSVGQIDTILQKAGMKGKYPVYAGGNPMQYELEPVESAGVDFIIKRAMAGTPENPLWIVGLGSATDIASAYLKEPRIKDRVIVFWHGRTHPTWPYRAHNYNVKGDMHAARMLFHAPFPFVLFDTGTHLSAGTLEESAKYVKPFGELGDYLYNYRLRAADWSGTVKGYFDLGDIAVLIDPNIGTWEESRCPTVTPYMDYNFYKGNGNFLRCSDIDRDKTFQLLYKKLQEKYGKK
jgi:inosine-uridine nucleoside N-ribohydrolase